MRIHLKFMKKAEVLESGGVSVEHDDPNDWSGIIQKASQRLFAEYLVSHREYLNEEFVFQPMEQPREVA